MSLDAERRRRFEAIAAEVHGPLQRYLRRRVPADDAGDLLSDVLLVVWRRVEDVPEPPLPWVYAVARRVVSNHRRSTQRRLQLVQRLESEPTPAMILDPAEMQADPDLADALADLPAADQDVLRLWAWEQLEPREIAVVLGSTPNAVSLRLGRARQKLADRLERQDRPPSGHKAERHTEEPPR